jgi:YD repeat-containing protein
MWISQQLPRCRRLQSLTDGKMKVTHLSDREKQGLRGPVKSCREEHTYPGTEDSEGRQRPAVKLWSVTDYDPEGRVASIRSSNSDGSEFVTRYAYDLSGRLLKMSQGNETERSAETVYSYGGDGRLLNITNSRTADNPVVFRYDEHGTKTKVQASRAADYRPNVATNADALLESADRPPNLPGGGTAVTIYDKQDRPAWGDSGMGTFGSHLSRYLERDDATHGHAGPQPRSRWRAPRGASRRSRFIDAPGV